MKIYTIEVRGFDPAIIAMRMPYENGYKSDSCDCSMIQFACEECRHFQECQKEWYYYIGTADLDLCQRLIKAGSSHRKFLRMIQVWAEITAPMYWWKQFDTYKVGTSASSSSTMHLLMKQKVSFNDFDGMDYDVFTRDYIAGINFLIEEYQKSDSEEERKKIEKRVIGMLPQGYKQMRIVNLNYEVLLNIYLQRKGHKLSEWQKFCKWIKTLPYMQEFLQED